MTATYTPHSFPSVTYPALTEGQFYITRPCFYVTVDDHPHDRVPPHILHELLTEKLTKSGKPAARQPKDEERHFWVAQLVHYGLAHSAGCSREEAKAVLRKALRNKDGKWTLGMTRAVKEIEGRLSKAASKTWDGEVTNIGSASGTAPAVTSDVGKQDKAASSTAAVSASKGKSKANAVDLIGEEARPAKKTKAERPASPYDFQQPVFGANGIDGTYRVSCESVEQEWPDGVDFAIAGDGALKWHVAIDVDGYLVGRINLAAYSAFIRSWHPVPPNARLGRAIHFRWKGRDKGTGEMQLGQQQVGEVTFDRKRFTGSLSGAALGEVDFNSVRPCGAFPSLAIAEWRREYEAMTEGRYEHERIDRWR